MKMRENLLDRQNKSVSSPYFFTYKILKRTAGGGIFPRIVMPWGMPRSPAFFACSVIMKEI